MDQAEGDKGDEDEAAELELAEQREDKENQVLAREGLETALMDEDASEAGEDIAHSD